MPTASGEAVLTGASLLAWGQLAAAAATAIFAGLTWAIYRRIKSVMERSNEILEETNEISSRSVKEMRVAREQELAPLVVIWIGEVADSPAPLERKRRVTIRLLNYGRGPALNLRRLRPNGTRELHQLDPRGGEEMELSWELDVDPQWEASKSVLVRYEDLLGNLWWTSLTRNSLRTTGPSPPEDWPE